MRSTPHVNAQEKLVVYGVLGNQDLEGPLIPDSRGRPRLVPGGFRVRVRLRQGFRNELQQTSSADRSDGTTGEAAVSPKGIVARTIRGRQHDDGQFRNEGSNPPGDFEAIRTRQPTVDKHKGKLTSARRGRGKRGQ